MHGMDKIKFTGTTWSFVKLMTLSLSLGLKTVNCNSFLYETSAVNGGLLVRIKRNKTFHIRRDASQIRDFIY